MKIFLSGRFFQLPGYKRRIVVIIIIDIINVARRILYCKCQFNMNGAIADKIQHFRF